MKTQSYKDLIVWQKSIKLVLEIYLFTEKFPKSELYGLVSQIRRAAVAIPSNIAEGYARRHRPEYIQFLSIAYSSAAELETQLIIAKELDYGEKNRCQEIRELLDEVSRMLAKMMKGLKE